MIQVTVSLYGNEEVGMFQQFITQLEESRHNFPKNKPTAPPVEAPEPASLAALAAVAHPLPAPKPINDAELETAITAYWKSKGLPAAKAILAKYGVERVGAISADQRRQALEDMTVAS